ncbi:MAG: alpha amylase C-terminal domain-containing protein, partial [Rikenellaceae bacterium]|nr:alpha amylase C-terminal domain-containing protein [Rikenellaceae bacterium]
QAFDHAMIKLEKDYDLLADGYPYRLQMDEGDKTIVFSHRNLVFVFNWHPTKSTNDYIIKVREPGKYKLIMSTDDVEFGGYGRMDHTSEHFTFPGESEDEHFMQVYNVCRTACIYEKIEE